MITKPGVEGSQVAIHFVREEVGMNFNEIRGVAKDLGLNTYRMRKTAVIQAIQRAEGKVDCFATPRVSV